MQTQVQEKRDGETMDSLDLYVGLATGLDDPFNIFIRVKDLEENNNLLYFYAYSMGKKRVVLWGVFDREKNEFFIDNACQYEGNDLKTILDAWKKNQYNFSFSSMKDRIKSRTNQFLYFGNDRNKEIQLMSDFRSQFLESVVRKTSLSSELLNLVALEALKALGSDLRASPNERRYEKSLELLFKEIDNLEDENTLRNIIYESVKSKRLILPKHLKQKIRYILINIFILVFLDMDEYRVAKYIDFLDKNKGQNDTNSKLSSYLKNKFLFEWIYELGKVLHVENMRQFAVDYARDILRLSEPNVNMTNIGVIGVRDTKIYSGVEEMVLFFEDFVAKSRYSKMSFTKNLPSCPKIDTCTKQGKNCDLFDYGVKTFSPHDLT